ncbi:Regulator of RNase E activity RraA [Geodermatophilus pulveris]|uniref:Putative 4-hydroxy-4-methyl-2-oxoglutarate aldolase n=1 Tax=Geodermatophilus pulveris TaxID=1564159 RepID=A0A239I647_9ACTN|nr:dimethylmenaquinone methyltransferase [Geodermatophilus pulveris]SNS89085.1 Regulator of RNase E activity RraA [Geodermatophilus pulveris]
MSTCRVHPPGPRPDDGLLARARALPTSILSDALARTGGVTGVLPVPGGRWPRVAGPALTVRTRPGDNLVVHRALDLARPGDVLVVDGGGALDRAVLGEIMARYAAARGLAALVVDGAVRDVEGLAAGALPVFARGVTHVGPYKDGPGEVGGAVQAGGTVVRAGDVVVGDADGVVVVPHERAAEVLADGEGLLRAEEAVFADIAAGTLDRSWVTAALTEVRVAP